MSIKSYSIQEEILYVFQRWHIFVLFCLMGSLIGWSVSLIWPSPYQATKELYVGINIYRADEDPVASELAGLRFTNADDYKNWQMANLNSLVLMDEVVEATLDRLRQEDAFWQGISREELRSMMRVYWRNAGKWRLVVKHAEALRAFQAVEVWAGIVVARVHLAVNEARTILALDTQIQAVASAQVQARARVGELSQVLVLLDEWRSNAVHEPENKQLNEAGRWQIWFPIAQADLNPAARLLLDKFPPQGATLKEYLSWVDLVSSTLQQEIRLLQAQIQTLEAEGNNLALQYAEASAKSLGLSTNLEVELMADAPADLTIVRPTGGLILVGCALGVIVWALMILTSLSKQLSQKKDESLSAAHPS